MSDILDWQQGTSSAITPDGFQTRTNLLITNPRVQDRLAHFSDTAYDLRPESHLSRLVKVLIGDSGVGLLRKRTLLTRLQSSLGGTHFFDLDRLWGSIFGISRQSSELLSLDPYDETATDEEWASVHMRDASYRARVGRFAEAIHLGATARGIEAVAEAMLGFDVDVIEEPFGSERWGRTWGDVSDKGTWGQVAALGTWGQVSWRDITDPVRGGMTPYHIVNVVPSRPISWEAAIDLQLAIDRIKPAGTVVRVLRSPGSSFTDVDIAAAGASSVYWELRPLDRDQSGSFVPRERFPWGARQGEIVSYIESDPKVVAYSIDGQVSMDKRFDPKAVELPAQTVIIGGSQTTFLPTYALKPLGTISAGRFVSDGVMVASPFDPDRNAFLPRLGSPSDDVLIEGKPARIIRVGEVPSQPRFWVSPARMWDSGVAEVLEFRLPSPVIVNEVTFTVSNFPGHYSFQRWEPAISQWVQVNEFKNGTSKPRVFSGAVPAGEIHPLHQGAGHWLPMEFTISNARPASAYRFVFTRDLSYGPVDFEKRHIPYSFALKDVELRYRVGTLDVIPNIDPNRPVVTMSNSAGDTTQWYMVTQGPELGIDPGISAWKCDAQPVSDAVVCYYLDVRDTLGDPTVVDRLVIDPLNVGPRFNLYWSDREPTTLDGAESPDHPVIPSETQGSMAHRREGTQGLQWANTPAWIEFSNKSIRFDPRSAWWLATEFYAGFASYDGTHTSIFSAGPADEAAMTDVSLVWDVDHFEFRAGGRVSTVEPVNPIPRGARVRLYLGYDPESGPSIHLLDPGGATASSVGSEPLSTTGVLDSAGGLFVMVQGDAYIGPRGLVTSGDGQTPQDVAQADGVALPLGDLTFLLDVALNDWQPGNTQTLWSIDGPGASDNVMKFEITSTGHLSLSLSEDGTNYESASSENVPVTLNSQFTELRIDWMAADGTVRFWYRNGTEWVSLGNDGLIDIEAPHAAPSVMTIGGLIGSPGNSTGGIFRRVAIERGFSGERVFDANWVVASRTPEAIRVGSSWGGNAMLLTSFALGYGSRPYESVLGDPDAYAVRPITGPGKTTGTILRYHPSYHGRLTAKGHSLGWMGGPADFWDEVEWTPLLSNVPLTKGAIDLPTTRTKFLKLEFTALAAEPYEPFLAPVKKVRKFPSSLLAATNPSRSISQLDLTMQNLTGANRYSDRPRWESFYSAYSGTTSPTAGIVPVDPVGREMVADAGYGFRLLPWQSGSSIPIFPEAGKHVYEEVALTHNEKVAFFVGIRSIVASRYEQRSANNARVHYESFSDMENVESFNFDVSPGAMFTPSLGVNALLPVQRVATGKVISSRSPIHAINFATTQSHPAQLIPDDTFRSPSLPYSSFEDPNGWTSSGDGLLVWDPRENTVKVTRNPADIESYFGPDTPIVHPPVTPVGSSTKARTITVVYNTTGGIQSPAFIPSPRGMLHLAARVSVDKNLGSPLYLRLYGSDGETVLAEKRIEARPFVQTEVTVSYALGNNPDLEQGASVRVEQTGPYTDSWWVHALSAFDESVLWEFTTDNGKNWVPALTGRNTLRGCVAFPAPGTGLRWRVTAYRYNVVIGSLQIRPWYSRRIGPQ